MKKKFPTFHAIIILGFLIVLLTSGDLFARHYVKKDSTNKRQTLVGKVKFRFEKVQNEVDGSTFEWESFVEEYKLGFRGYVWDARFMPVDAHLEFVKATFSSGGKEFSFKDLNYGFFSTILPKSLFPFSLYANRSTSWGGTRTRTTNSYGISWLLNFHRLPRISVYHRLPETRVYVDRLTKSTGGTETDSTRYGISMRKRIIAGKTKYNFGFSSGGSQGSSGESSSNHSFSMSATTDVSSRTKLMQGLGYSASEVTSGDGIRTENRIITAGSTLHLNPRPGVRQIYRYTFLNSKSHNDEHETHFLNAVMKYRVSRKLELSADSSYRDSIRKSETAESKARTFSTSARAHYLLTKRTNTRFKLFYEMTETSQDPPSEDGDSFESAVGASASISHSIPFKWFSLGLSANLTYEHIMDKPDQGRDDGFLFSNAASITASRTIKVRDYFSLIGKYRFVDKNSSRKEETSHKFQLNAESTYFKNTNIKAYFLRLIKEKVREVDNDTITTNIDTTTYGGNVRHRRRVMRGRLLLESSYRKDIFELGENSEFKVMGEYTKALTWYLKMTLGLDRASFFDDGGGERVRYKFKSRFDYRLRAWLIVLNYSYRLRTKGEEATDETESRIVVTISRKFKRVLR